MPIVNSAMHKSDEVAIENMVRDFGRQEIAKKRFLDGKA